MGSPRQLITCLGFLSATASASSLLRGQAQPDTLRAVVPPLRDSVPATSGMRPRLEVGAAVGTIGADTIVPTAPVFQFTDLLAGRLAGVDVQSGGGLTGSGARLLIRGTGSVLAGTDPVVYLDGVRVAADPGSVNRAASDPGTQAASGPLASGRLEDLSPDEIERVDVLSGPAATTTYGSDAANGVVLVTTRRPGVGKPHWAAYAEGGGLSPPPGPTYGTYVSWGHTTGPTPTATTCPLVAQGAGTCVLDSLTHYSPLASSATSPIATGRRDQYGVQVGGGVGPSRYFLSAEQRHETGILEMPLPDLQLYEIQDGHAPFNGQLRPNSLDRTNLRASLGADLGPRGSVTLFGNAIDGAHSGIDEQSLAEATAIGSGSAQVNDGWLSALFRPRTLFANDATDRVERYVYGANTTWRLLPGLSVQATAGADRANAHDETQARAVDNPGLQFPSITVTDHLMTEQYTASASVTGLFVRQGGWSSQSTAGVQYREQAGQESQLADLVDSKGVQYQSSDAIQRGAFAEEVIGLADRLFVTGALRVDGPHGLFGKSSYGDPRVAISWAALEPGSDVLRLRAAFGQSANIASIQAPLFQSSVCTGPGGLFTPCFGLGPESLPERTREYEAGFDATALSQRVTLSASVYDRTTDHALLVASVAASGGVETGALNLATFRNRGVEATLALSVVHQHAVSWDVDLVGWANQNRVVMLGVPTIYLTAVDLIEQGYPLYSLWEPNLTYHDSNGDGIIEPNEISLSAPAYQGNSVPTRALSLHNGVTLFGGRLRCAALVDYRGGNNLIDNVLALQNALGISRAENDRRAPLAEQAQAVAVQAAGFFSYPGPAEDASFVRLRELSITLAASPRIARALRTSTASVSLLARNLWLWTRYGGTDPELNTNGNTEQIVTGTVVPQPRYFVLRVNLGL